MVFPVSATLLDALVLSIVSKEDTYGYKITQEIREAMEMSESTLYPVLRRLLKNECLESYDKEYMGRNRRYYKVTDKGMSQLELYMEEWVSYKSKINKLLGEGCHPSEGRISL
jgi:PadR family transcriptional regulator PadR